MEAELIALVHAVTTLVKVLCFTAGVVTALMLTTAYANGIKSGEDA